MADPFASIGYYDRQGKPMPCSAWLETLTNQEARLVGYARFPDGTYVSTVWLGLEHGRDNQGRPIIFETMVFTAANEDLFHCRYATEDDALAGHREAVCCVLAGELGVGDADQG